MFECRILCYINVYPTQPNVVLDTLNLKSNNTIALSHIMSKDTLTLEEKGQYVTNAFTTTCDYLVFATKFLRFTINVTSC